MKTLSLLFAAVLALPAVAQDPAATDVLKGLKFGDRAELVLVSGFAIQGKIVPTNTDNMMLEKSSVIMLDVSIEYPEMKSGHIGVERVQIKSSRKLPGLTAAELEQREKARQQALRRMALEDTARRQKLAAADQEDADLLAEIEKKKKDEAAKQLGADLLAKKDLLEKGKKLYEKFPPPAWGQEKLGEIASKPVSLPRTDDEKEFAANFSLWLAYKQYVEDQKAKDKEKAVTSDKPIKTEEKKPEESAAPKTETPK